LEENVMRHLVVFASVSLLLASSSQAQEVTTGPEKGAKVPALKVFDATGIHKDEEADYAADRAGKPTVYLLIDAEKFDRPMNRFMKTLDGIVAKDFEGAYIVAVWLTSDADKTKALLPRVQESVQYQVTALTLFPGAKEGPKGWAVNADAHLTAVVANKGKVAATFGYRSINETDVPKVKEALKKAIQGN
jgi:hypothetical protein